MTATPKLDKIFLDEEKPKQRINTYKCPQGHTMVTVDREHGTTPMRKACMIIDDGRECGAIALSSWYQCNQDLVPEFEWYRPTTDQKLTSAERDHCKQGGLLIRRIGEQPATPKKADDGTTVGRNEPCPCGAMTTGDNPRPKKFKHCHINDPAGLAIIILQKGPQA